jgi:hypothetical protein
MITIESPENGRILTIHSATPEDADRAIAALKVPLQETTVMIRCKIPGIAFEEIVKDVVGSGGKIL